ncbi:phage tail assembly protein T [Paraburkholderia bannensis]|uniref:phage tail assembly protein T n=1 Tax=Paraburkholderia bannensis TaxID=765414 RepID=UPI0005A84C0D|nr:hypothetical protein [Paraburkholderia bannensis]
MSVSRAQREIDSVEFAHWMAYYNIEPFGTPIENLRMGIVASTMANIHRDPKRPAFAPADFIPGGRKPDPVLFDDPKDQARFVALSVFGVDLSQAKGRKKFKVKRRASG